MKSLLETMNHYNDIPELGRIKPLLKCIYICKICKKMGGTYIISHTIFEELKKLPDIKYFNYRVPYFSGVLLKDQDIMIVFLNDGYDQYQIHKTSIENDNIKTHHLIEQGYGNDYLKFLDNM